MAKVVTMPKLGLTMTEGKLIKWYKTEGEAVAAGEALYEVATDKLTNTIEAPESGVLRRRLVEEGAVVPCLKPLAIIAAPQEEIDSLMEVQEEAAPGPAKPAGRTKASPVAKKLAEEKNVDLQTVRGTGPQGRITLEDVERHIALAKEKLKASPMAVKTAAALSVDLSEIKKDSRIMRQDVQSHYESKQLSLNESLREKRIPMSQMRKVIAHRMTESWHTSPAVTFQMRVDVSRLKALREQLKESCRLTYTDLLVKILGSVLPEHPYLNSRLEEETIVMPPVVNLGVAVALPDGLVVPVVREANRKGLGQISAEIKTLAEKARAGQLTQDELTGGTFTLTNLGMYGIEAFSPIINQPEVAILGVNRVVETPAVVNGSVEIKPLMNISLTADHRVVDGAVAAQFMARLKTVIENPEQLLL